MFKSIKIKNFQSHKNTTLDLAEGINVITGSSNNGKTAVFRAFNWVINNRPSGSAFISSFAGKKEPTTVELYLDETYKITRLKKGTKNQYHVEGVDGDSALYEALGSKVPYQVTDVINLNEINIQNQFDKHFLLTDSPGEVGRVINKLLQIDTIDSGVSEVNRRVNDGKKEEDFLNKDVATLTQELEQYEHLPEIEMSIFKLTNLDVELELKKMMIARVGQAVRTVNELDAELAEAEEVLMLELQYISIDNLMDSLSSEEEFVRLLSKLIEDYKESLTVTQSLSSNTTHEASVDGVKQILVDIEGMYRNIESLTKVVDDNHYYAEAYAQFDARITKAQQEFGSLMEEYGCPLCERPL